MAARTNIEKNKEYYNKTKLNHPNKYFTDCTSCDTTTHDSNFTALDSTPIHRFRFVSFRCVVAVAVAVPTVANYIVQYNMCTVIE